jgi:hypothetical protein
MRLTPKAQAERYEKLRQRMAERVDEMLTPPTLAEKVYPHLAKAKPAEPDQSKREPIQGWSHLRKK